MPPFVTIDFGHGLFGITKVQWLFWPSRNWLSWTIAAVFLIVAVGFIYFMRKGNIELWRPQNVVRYVSAAILFGFVLFRLILEGTVSKPPPGQPPPWDQQLVDPWWSSIHTMTGVVLGVWLVPFFYSALLTCLWEVLEIAVPGFGDQEINGNRLTDLLLAWLGWLIAASIVSWISRMKLPLIRWDWPRHGID